MKPGTDNQGPLKFYLLKLYYQREETFFLQIYYPHFEYYPHLEI